MLHKCTLLFLLTGFALPCLAQVTTATLLGTATDPSGAVLPNVAVKATNLATNASRETLSDVSGNFTLPFLTAGDYDVSASLAGFQAQKIKGLTLQVQQTARIDFQFKVGDVSESVSRPDIPHCLLLVEIHLGSV
jgi:hypothetical protein